MMQCIPLSNPRTRLLLACSRVRTPVVKLRLALRRKLCLSAGHEKIHPYFVQLLGHRLHTIRNERLLISWNLLARDVNRRI